MENRHLANTVLRILAQHLNIPVQNIDVTKSFDENGGDSIILMSVIKELRQLNLQGSITELFEPPNTLQDLLDYMDSEKASKVRADNSCNLKIKRFADAENKEELIDMYCRSFAEKNILFSSCNILAEDILPYVLSIIEEDAKYLLSFVVYDTLSGRFTGGAFLFSQAASENVVCPEKMYPIRDLNSSLTSPHVLSTEKKNILYLKAFYAEPSLPSAINLETFRLLAKQSYLIAEESNLQAIATVAVPFTKVCHPLFLIAQIS